MHQLIRVLVPFEGHPDTDADHPDELADDPVARYVDNVFAFARSYVEDSIAIHGEGRGGYADWFQADAGRFADYLADEHGDANRYPLVTDDHPERVVLLGDAAQRELEDAWEATREEYERCLTEARTCLIEADVEPSELFAQDPVELREDAMLQHHLGNAFGYAPGPECHAYIAEVYTPVDRPSRYDYATELIEDGAGMALFDVHY